MNNNKFKEYTNMIRESNMNYFNDKIENSLNTSRTTRNIINRESGKSQITTGKLNPQIQLTQRQE